MVNHACQSHFVECACTLELQTHIIELFHIRTYVGNMKDYVIDTTCMWRCSAKVAELIMLQ